MPKYTVNLTIGHKHLQDRLNPLKFAREPEYEVVAENSVEAAILGILRANVDLGSEYIHMVHIGREME